MCYIVIMKNNIHLQTLVFSLILVNTSMIDCAYVNGKNMPSKLSSFFWRKILYATFHQPNHNVATLTLGSRPRQRGCKVASQEEGSPGVKAKALQGCGPRGSSGVTSHILGSVRKCEGV